MNFETDYIISWDISENDFPTISVAKLKAEKNRLIIEQLGISREQSGVISLRQLLEEAEAKRRADSTGEI